MGGYDNRTAVFLAAVCSQTYAQYNDPDGRYVVPSPFVPVGEIRARAPAGAPERFGFVLESDTHAIVAFRGTSSTNEWVADAMASQVRYPFVKNAGSTHRGFTNMYDSARKGIFGLMDGVPKDKTIYVTGHSLGGALAALCALDLAANAGFRNPVVYTFGSPRAGDPAFRKAFGNKVGESYRVNNRFDVVTHLPPTTYKLPKRDKTFYYEHVRKAETLAFHNGSVPGNHVIGSYYAALAVKDPLFAEQLSLRNPGFCPLPDRDFLFV